MRRAKAPIPATAKIPKIAEGSGTLVDAKAGGVPKVKVLVPAFGPEEAIDRVAVAAEVEKDPPLSAKLPKKAIITPKSFWLVILPELAVKV